MKLKKFPIIQAAGGLVERTDGKLLFIFRNDKWDLPKGGVEKKELIIEAAKSPALKAPFSPMATVPTGIPFGI